MSSTAGVEPPAKQPRKEDDADALHVRIAEEDSEENEWSDDDYFPECPSDVETDADMPDEWCHLSKEFIETPDHAYTNPAIEVSFNVAVEEISESMDQDVQSILTEALDEFAFAAKSAVRKRNTEVRERMLSASEKEAFRVAKHRERGSFIDNTVVQ